MRFDVAQEERTMESRSLNQLQFGVEIDFTAREIGWNLKLLQQ